MSLLKEILSESKHAPKMGKMLPMSKPHMMLKKMRTVAGKIREEQEYSVEEFLDVIEELASFDEEIGESETDDEIIEEKWGKKVVIPEKEKGKYKGWTLAELRSALSKLKKSGPHKKGSPSHGKMYELMFAIRSKTGWGKVKAA